MAFVTFTFCTSSRVARLKMAAARSGVYVVTATARAWISPSDQEGGDPQTVVEQRPNDDSARGLRRRTLRARTPWRRRVKIAARRRAASNVLVSIVVPASAPDRRAQEDKERESGQAIMSRPSYGRPALGGHDGEGVEAGQEGRAIVDEAKEMRARGDVMALAPRSGGHGVRPHGGDGAAESRRVIIESTPGSRAPAQSSRIADVDGHHAMPRPQDASRRTEPRRIFSVRRWSSARPRRFVVRWALIWGKTVGHRDRVVCSTRPARAGSTSRGRRDERARPGVRARARRLGRARMRDAAGLGRPRVRELLHVGRQRDLLLQSASVRRHALGSRRRLMRRMYFSFLRFLFFVLRS